MNNKPNTIKIESCIAKLPALRKDAATTQLVKAIQDIVTSYTITVQTVQTELRNFRNFIDYVSYANPAVQKMNSEMPMKERELHIDKYVKDKQWGETDEKYRERMAITTSLANPTGFFSESPYVRMDGVKEFTNNTPKITDRAVREYLNFITYKMLHQIEAVYNAALMCNENTIHILPPKELFAIKFNFNTLLKDMRTLPATVGEFLTKQAKYTNYQFDINNIKSLAEKLNLIIMPLELAAFSNKGTHDITSTIKNEFIDKPVIGARYYIATSIEHYSIQQHMMLQDKLPWEKLEIYASSNCNQAIAACKMVIPTLRLLSDQVKTVAKQQDIFKQQFENMLNSQRNNLISVHSNWKNSITAKLTDLTKKDIEEFRSKLDINTAIIFQIRDTNQSIDEYDGHCVLRGIIGDQEIHSSVAALVDLQSQ